MNSFIYQGIKYSLALYVVFVLIIIFTPEPIKPTDRIIFLVVFAVLALILGFIGAIFSWIGKTSVNTIKHIDEKVNKD